jgi:hypothetical protein
MKELKELLEVEFSKDILLVKNGSLKAIISFTNPLLLKEFLEVDNFFQWLSNVLKIDNGYFDDVIIDWNEQYLDVSDDKFYKELKEADVFVI